MAQRAFRPKFFEQLLGPCKYLFVALTTAKQASPGPRNLLFSKQSDTSWVSVVERGSLATPLPKLPAETGKEGIDHFGLPTLSLIIISLAEMGKDDFRHPANFPALPPSPRPCSEAVVRCAGAVMKYRNRDGVLFHRRMKDRLHVDPAGETSPWPAAGSGWNCPGSPAPPASRCSCRCSSRAAGPSARNSREFSRNRATRCGSASSKRKRRQRGRGRRRRHGRGKHESRRPCSADTPPTPCSRQCTRRNCPSALLNVPIQTSTSPRSTPKCSPMPRPVGPQHAHRVGLVDHQQRLVPLLHLDEAGQVGNVAVHAVHALDRDQHAAILVPELFQQVGRRPASRCAETAAAAPRTGGTPARCCCGPARRAGSGRRGPSGGRSPFRWWRGRPRRRSCLPCPETGSAPASNSTWILFWPDTSRLAEALVP